MQLLVKSIKYGQLMQSHPCSQRDKSTKDIAYFYKKVPIVSSDPLSKSSAKKQKKIEEGVI